MYNSIIAGEVRKGNPLFFTLLLTPNKFIMKVNRERNPYLKRILSQQPHKYSYPFTYPATTSNKENTTCLMNRAKQPTSIPTAPFAPNSDPTTVDSSVIRVATMMQNSTLLSFISLLIPTLILPTTILCLINSQAMHNTRIK
jgi:hypothetical protein